MKDIVVIGGGVSGLGVALEAARAGLAVTLLEKGEWASATSANSLRIMHGGVRYLQSLNLARTVESLRDQQYLKATFPQAVRPISCFLGLRWGQAANPLTVPLLSAGYNLAARFTVGESRGAGLCSRAALPEQGAWIPDDWSLLFRWSEYLLTDPALLARNLVGEAQRLGAECLTGAAVTGVEVQPSGVRVSTLRGTFEASAVVDTTGPWLGSIPGLAPWPGQLWTKGFNFVISRRLVAECAVGAFGGEGRAFFFVPRGDKTAIGTWYEPFSGDPAELSVGEEECGRFLTAINRALPRLALRREEVEAIEAGVLPAASFTPKLRLVGRERIAVRGRVVQVLSTKYTTFRSQGKRVVEVLRGVLSR